MEQDPDIRFSHLKYYLQFYLDKVIREKRNIPYNSEQTYKEEDI